MGGEIVCVRVLLRRDGGVTHPHAPRQRRDGTPDGNRRILAAPACHFGENAGIRLEPAGQRKNIRRHLGSGAVLTLSGLLRKTAATDSRHEFVTTNPARD